MAFLPIQNDQNAERKFYTGRGLLSYCKVVKCTNMKYTPGKDRVHETGERSAMNKYIKKERCNEMYEAILSLKTVDECKKFFDDLCTVSELQAMEQRFQVAVLLHQGNIYNDILEKTGASSATISRVNRSLQYGSDGYAVVFERLGIAGKEGK